MQATTYQQVHLPRRSTATGGVFHLLRPVPLAVFLFPFAYAAQVVVQDARVGVVPYVLLFVGISNGLVRAVRRLRADRSTPVSLLDFGVGVFVLFSALQIGFGLALAGYSAATAIRWLLVNVGSAAVFVHVSRYATRAEIRALMLAVSLSSIIVGAEWMHETYEKLVLQEISWYQMRSAEYSQRRQNFADSQVNPSGTGLYYRAHGLVEKHTSTGATVALGAFATVALFPRLRRGRRMLVFLAFLVVLSIGQATTAWLAYVFTMCVALNFLSPRRRRFGELARGVVYGGIAVVLVFSVASSIASTRGLIDKILEIVSVQFANVVNLDVSRGEMSFVWLYWHNVTDYWRALNHAPWVLLIGQGPEAGPPPLYSRGGDVGWLEVVAAYGVPMSVLFFGVCSTYVWRAFRSLQRPELDAASRAELMFGAAAVTFLVVALIHYDVLFRKSLHVCFYLALGLVRRHLGTISRLRLRPSRTGDHPGGVAP